MLPLRCLRKRIGKNMDIDWLVLSMDLNELGFSSQSRSLLKARAKRRPTNSARLLKSAT